MTSATLPAGVLAAAQEALAGEPGHDRTVLLALLHRHWPDLLAGLVAAYGDEGEQLAARAAALAVDGFLARPEWLVEDVDSATHA